ncbi:MAG: PQQ-binding-like beta-propeller repeat protein [Acidimicrobiales bacterium]|nr:PQQ-binding-like beta-propeller repeat protein [Acidimicrobiales bacterium]
MTTLLMRAASFLVLVVVGLVALVVVTPATEDDRPPPVVPTPTVDPVELAALTAPTPTPTPPPTPTPTPYEGWVDPASSGQPWSPVVEGLLTFRGSPTRSYYGAGPVPTAPRIQWSYPQGGSLCAASTVGSETTTWCGTGWTGQPSMFERDGRPWAVFGAYDRNIHFVDAETGADLMAPFPTGDIIKGSVTIDPDGFPLVYSGSRDNYLHIVAIDREQPVELYRLSAQAVSPTLWNDDWDGSPMVIDDYLFEGGENSVFHILKLNRGYDADGRVTVAPELVFYAPGWDDELLANHGQNVSIENSVVITGNTVYFSNSGGLVQGWDITGLAEGAVPQRVFRYWTGDDVDATIVADDEGMLYVGVEYETGRARAQQVGQILKLDPTRPDDPLVWSIADQGTLPAGVWATVALHRDMVYASTETGRLLGIDRATGQIRWEKRLPGPLWSSQVVVDDVLLQGDCEGTLHAFDVSDTTIEPPEIWSVFIGGCIESTPAVWNGRIIVGTRSGQVHMIADD